MAFFPTCTHFRVLYAMLSLLILTTACQEAEVNEPLIENKDHRYVNDWILENMENLYLWNEELPEGADKNLPPDEYFKSLLSDADRFSWIQADYQSLIKSLNGINKEAGYEFVLYRDANDASKVVAQILYVKPGSPALAAGLKRGDLIVGINGTQPTTENYQSLIQELKDDHVLRYKPILTGEKAFGPETTASLSVVEYTENPNYLHTVITEGDHKIGYFVYNLFASGPDDQSDVYDLEMNNAFSAFKAEGITDLVLDLRFNSGGSEVAAKNLASLIGTGISGSSLFFRREYNQQLTTEIINDPDMGEEFLSSYFLEKSANVGDQLLLKRVYVLTSSRTASASELVINGLEPYMDVYLIGDVTYGKNVGSISIYEENDARNAWGIQPIVVKVTNSAGFSDYGDGFQPDIENKDNSLYLYPLGDPRENLLATAIAHITGAETAGRVRASSVDGRAVLAHSLDLKRSSYVLDMAQPLFKPRP
jgi:carboxyl-terminal processing protease